MNEYTTTVSREGRVLIPAAMRRELGFRPGDALTLCAVGGELRVMRREDGLRRLQRRMKRLRDPENPAVDELLRERHEAAARE